MEVIVAQKLGKTFAVKQKRPGMAGSLEAIFSPTFKEIEAVRDVSLSVEEGETVAFIGPKRNGDRSGYSSLAREAAALKGDRNSIRTEIAAVV